MKQSITRLTGLTLLLGLCLGGCQLHKNKLLTENKRDVGRFLFSAQIYASKKTRILQGSGVYTMCIVNPGVYTPFSTDYEKGPCKKIMKAMVEYAKTTKQFHNITVADLDDPAVLERVGQNLIEYYHK